METYIALAKVSVILEQIKVDELVYESSQYTAYYMDIQEQGVYWLLCQLVKVTLSMDVPEISRDFVREIENSQEDGSLSDRALRHMRDYIVLRDLHRLLSRVTVMFALMAEQQVL